MDHGLRKHAAVIVRVLGSAQSLGGVALLGLGGVGVHIFVSRLLVDSLSVGKRDGCRLAQVCLCLLEINGFLLLVNHGLEQCVPLKASLPRL